MSIPKEPRQLMINLMYLVLTAMLALNVSAEIMNAFFTLDRGNTKSSAIIDGSNKQMMSLISQQAEAYDDPGRRAAKKKAERAAEIAEEFSAYINSLRQELMDGAGGPSEADPNIPEDKGNKEITTRLLVGEPPEFNAKGMELKGKIDAAREELLGLLDENDRAAFADKIALKADPVPEGGEKTNWADYNFYQMPVAAVFPMLSKYELDVKSSSTSLLNYFFNKVVGKEIKFDAFEPVVSAKKGYVIAGEPYEAEIFLSAFSTQNSGGTRISVNGTPLQVQGGKATYKTTSSQTGVKKYKVAISVTNPLTKKSDTYSKTFEYEVGRRSVAVSADKMNVFYLGVKNPITVAAAGVSSNDLRVSCSGCTLSKTGKGKYDATATKPGKATITVSGGGLKATNFEYRIKKFPDPIATMGTGKTRKGGRLGNGRMRVQTGLIAELEGFLFDAKCNIQSFNMTYMAKRQDGVPAPTNKGGRFNSDVQRLVKKAKPGDLYYFENIKARCPGDAVARDLNSLVFKIK